MTDTEQSERQNILVRLGATAEALESLGDGGLDIAYEISAVGAAESLIRSIHQVLDGREWDSATTSDIADLLTVQGMDIREPRDDCELTAAELQERYAEVDGGWGEHPRHSRSVWKGYVSCNDTQRGYWDWVVFMLEQEAD